ncbi:MAG TPA: glycosyltransferase family 2 protein [Elusimicrobiota bacterium]|jgi:cellulose synthase/poly-beta-1,6-N-acetylglucosamine synthase-like glycosyltransferase|nr:glycosyltransferase family 2 protein [Elusimicrobiota bacterium]
MEETPLVTVAIPCLDEERFIERCVREALAQDYPAGRLEVVAADGGSRDRTRELLAGLARADGRVRVVDNPGRIQARGMNEILRVARGEVIVRLDAHSDYARDYVSQCIKELRRTGADNVGGTAQARAETPFQLALCAALDSPLGVGGAGYRIAGAEGYVDTVFCGAFPRSVFERVGLYDPGAVVNEDAELNQRIAASGGRIYLSPRIVAHYYPRSSLSALVRQYFRYGQGRARTILKGRRLRPRNLGPFLAVSGGAALLLAAPRSPVTWGLFALYALATGIEARRVARGRPAARALSVWPLFPAMHAAHGCGMLSGFLRYGLRPDWGPPELLAPRAGA